MLIGPISTASSHVATTLDVSVLDIAELDPQLLAKVTRSGVGLDAQSLMTAHTQSLTRAVHFSGLTDFGSVEKPTTGAGAGAVAGWLASALERLLTQVANRSQVPGIEG